MHIGAEPGRRRDDYRQGPWPPPHRQTVRCLCQGPGLSRLILICGNQRNGLVGGAMLEGKQPLDRLRRARVDGEAVKRVGRKGHDAASTKRAHGGRQIGRGIVMHHL